jgi:hypothetical protein
VTSTEPGDPSRGEVLKSNVDARSEPDEVPRRRAGISVLPMLLIALLIFVVGAGATLVFMDSQSRSAPRAVATAAPVAAGQTTTSGGASDNLADVNGISCDTLEGTVEHIHMHLAIFVNGQEQQVPMGIGIGQPWQVADSDEGPFVEDGSCFYWLHTHTEDGIVHIESPLRRRFTLGDFFAIWQMTLNENQVGPAQGPVIVYVNGQRSNARPQDIPLLSHERVQLDVGNDVPPYQFDFPDGD